MIRYHKNTEENIMLLRKTISAGLLGLALVYLFTRLSSKVFVFKTAKLILNILQ